jgi:flagellum-specific ATP synthase
MIDIVPTEHLKIANKVRDILATYKEAQDLINIGAYVPGSNPKIDYARSVVDRINNFLKQDLFEKFEFSETQKFLFSLFEQDIP